MNRFFAHVIDSPNLALHGLVALLTVLCLSHDEVSAQTDADQPASNKASLRIRLSYKGEPPAPALLDGKLDQFCKNCMIPDERLLVSRNGELQNVLLIWDDRKNKENFPKSFAPITAKQIEVKFEGCRIRPHIVIARVGQEIITSSLDRTGHNPNYAFLNHSPPGTFIPAGQPRTQSLTVSEPVPISIECGVHDWERAYLVVQEHPFVGLSDAHGVIEIKGLPLGKNWFYIWHESIANKLEYVVWNGSKVQLLKRRISFELAPGINDLGVIELDAKQFRPLLR